MLSFDIVFSDLLQPHFGAGLGADVDKTYAVGRNLLLKCTHGLKILKTGRAPGCPEIDDNGLVPVCLHNIGQEFICTSIVVSFHQVDVFRGVFNDCVLLKASPKTVAVKNKF